MRPLGFLLLFVNMAVAQTYPAARRSDTVETLHGVSVADPYRWMEDVDSAETRRWVDEQVKFTNQWFGRLPGRDPIRQRLTALSDMTVPYLPVLRRGGKLFYQRRAPGQNQPVLFVEEKGKTRTLLDPNTLSSAGTVALTFWVPSPDGSLLAYGISKAGSDWVDIRIRKTANGEDLVDVVEWTKFNNLEWKKDGSGFFYARFLQPEANAVLTSQARNHTLYFHRVGSKQEDDEVIYAPREHPEWLLSAWVAPDGKSLYISVAAASSNNALYYRDLERKEAPVIPLIEGFTDANQPIGQIAGKVIVRTTKDAPNGRVVSFDPRKPEPGNWTTLIPERKEPLEDALMAPGKILTSYLVDVKSSLRVYSLDGKLENEVKLPAPGVAIWSDQSEQETERYFTFETITSPASVYRYDTERRTVSLVFQPERTFDASQYETIQVFYPSKDGTKIPMFLSYKKGLQRNGTNPVMLYGYGGFNISLTPRFSPYPLGWMEMGGIYAVANLRGGGEYGEKWHLAGSKQNKQNVFDDFIAAAEWLIGEKYTNSKKLAILGGSNGGLLVGACLNQRPDLFAAAIPAVGVMDMLRFHKFTIGAAWAGDYGNPDLPEDFAVVRKYSPIHNIKKGTVYPATLISTADHDDRVVPAHSFKYAATMQYSQEGKAPILIRIETQAGHGGGKPKSKQIDEWTDMIAFLRDSLAMAPRPQ